MTPNELINKLKLVRCIAGDGQILNEAETMLRQQQAEIEALKAHPVKELTDEEIEDECRKAWGLHDQDQLNLTEVFKFARAILRKAKQK